MEKCAIKQNEVYVNKYDICIWHESHAEKCHSDTGWYRQFLKTILLAFTSVTSALEVF